MHISTFEYLKPTEDQLKQMSICRDAATTYAATLNTYLPDGPDKTFIMRKFREVAMWTNIAITRNPDGSPRS